MSGFRRFLHSNRHAEDEQYAPDGRDLSDTAHPDYDPATDPELRESSFGSGSWKRSRTGERALVRLALRGVRVG